MGTDADHILEMKYVTFGNKPKSSYILSNAGVILTGNIPRLLNNLSYLPINRVPVGAVQQSMGNVNVGAAVAEGMQDAFSGEATGGSTPDAGKCMVESHINVSNNSLDSSADSKCQKLLEDLLSCGDVVEDESNLTNDQLTEYVLQVTERDENGRLVMPLLWNNKIAHLLGTNYKLAKSILHSNLNKLKQNSDKLLMYDSVVKDQIKDGMIEEVNLNYMSADNLQYSFLLHMGVYRLSHETTKCRVVYMSNLYEKSKTNVPNISHTRQCYPIQI